MAAKMTPESGEIPVGGARTGAEGGFTMTELIITVGIIGILASLAIVVYMNFRNKAMTVEARVGLRQIWQLEKDYDKDHDTYSNDLNAINFKMVGTPRYTYSVTADTNSFTARAEANLDRDADLDTWEIYDTSPESIHLVID